MGFDTFTSIRGLYATKPFKKNEIICKIPSDVALALTDPSTATGETMSVVDGGVNLLGWYLNNEQARGMWSAYLETLPTREMHFDVRSLSFVDSFMLILVISVALHRDLLVKPTPDFFSDAEIEGLELPMIINKANQRKQQLSHISQSQVSFKCSSIQATLWFIYLTWTFSSTQNIPYDELQFASWLVASRSFAIKISVDDPLVKEGVVSTSEKAIRVLLPYLDMINHSSDNPNAELHLIDPEKDDGE